MSQRKVSKFDIGDLLPIGLTFVLVGISIAYGLNVMGDVRDDIGCPPDEFLEGGTCFSPFNSSHRFFVGSGTCANGTQGPGIDNTSCLVGGDSTFNATNNSILGVAKIPAKLPLIATVVVAAVIIGIIVRYLLIRFN